MKNLKRITSDDKIMGGKPCIRGTRVTVKTIVELHQAGNPVEVILANYPYLEVEDIKAAIELDRNI